MCWVIPTVLRVDNVGVTDRVEQLGLTVVDVAHDRDDRGTRLHILCIVQFFGFEVDVEGLEQFAILVFRRNNLDVVAELCAQCFEGVLIQRLRGGCHLSQVEENGHQRCGIDVNLLSKVGKRGTLTDADLLTIAARNRNAANDGCVLLFKLLTLCTLRLTSARALAATATECARRCAAATTATTARRSETATGVCSGSALAATITATRTGTAASATTRTFRRRCWAPRASEVRLSGHHSRVRTRAATGRCATALRTRPTLTCSLSATGTCRAFALCTTCGTVSTATTLAATGTGHALAGCVGVVSGARAAGTGCSGTRRTRLGCRATGTRGARSSRLRSTGCRLGGFLVASTSLARCRLGSAGGSFGLFRSCGLWCCCLGRTRPRLMSRRLGSFGSCRSVILCRCCRGGFSGLCGSLCLGLGGRLLRGALSVTRC